MPSDFSPLFLAGGPFSRHLRISSSQGKRVMARRTFLAVFVVLSSLIGAAAVAQEARGTIQGRVVDASGAAVPGATVEVLNIATGVVTPTTTNAEGSYRAPFLIPGAYRVTVTLQGFSKFV